MFSWTMGVAELRALGKLNTRAGRSRTLRVQGPKRWVLGPKYYNVNGIWALNPYYLGPWTLRGRCVIVSRRSQWPINLQALGFRCSTQGPICRPELLIILKPVAAAVHDFLARCGSFGVYCKTRCPCSCGP